VVGPEGTVASQVHLFGLGCRCDESWGFEMASEGFELLAYRKDFCCGKGGSLVHVLSQGWVVHSDLDSCGYGRFQKQ